MKKLSLILNTIMEGCEWLQRKIHFSKNVKKIKLRYIKIKQKNEKTINHPHFGRNDWFYGM